MLGRVALQVLGPKRAGCNRRRWASAGRINERKPLSFEEPRQTHSAPRRQLSAASCCYRIRVGLRNLTDYNWDHPGGRLPRVPPFPPIIGGAPPPVVSVAEAEPPEHVSARRFSSSTSLSRKSFLSFFFFCIGTLQKTAPPCITKRPAMLRVRRTPSLYDSATTLPRRKAHLAQIAGAQYHIENCGVNSIFSL